MERKVQNKRRKLYTGKNKGGARRRKTWSSKLCAFSKILLIFSFIGVLEIRYHLFFLRVSQAVNIAN